MANFHKHDYHGNVKPTKINKRKRKEGKHEKENEKNPFNPLSRSYCTALEC